MFGDLGKADGTARAKRFGLAHEKKRGEGCQGLLLRRLLARRETYGPRMLANLLQNPTIVLAGLEVCMGMYKTHARYLRGSGEESWVSGAHTGRATLILGSPPTAKLPKTNK
jgi:hypothetical protein